MIAFHKFPNSKNPKKKRKKSEGKIQRKRKNLRGKNPEKIRQTNLKLQHLWQSSTWKPHDCFSQILFSRVFSNLLKNIWRRFSWNILNNIWRQFSSYLSAKICLELRDNSISHFGWIFGKNCFACHLFYCFFIGSLPLFSPFNLSTSVFLLQLKSDESWIESLESPIVNTPSSSFFFFFS